MMDMPKADNDLIDHNLERRMALAQTIVFLARSLREKSKIRTRQPLSRIMIPVITPQQRRDIQAVENIITEEINVKAVEYVSDDAGIMKRSVKPNFKNLGKRFGKNTQLIANHVKLMDADAIRHLITNGVYSLHVEHEINDIFLDDVEIISEDMEGWLIANEGSLTVALDTELDETLINEGIAREFVNRIQNARKNEGLIVTDRISLEFNAPKEIEHAILSLHDYICSEILAVSCIASKDIQESALHIDIDGVTIQARITKVND
jgi:isoleucyl-tRNA synthetase